MTQIAVIGMGCRYAEVRSPRQLWENVLAQRRSFRRIPRVRLNLDDYSSATQSEDNITAVMAAVLEPSLSKAEQSNSSIRYGDRLILKLFRRLQQGVNPEVEIGSFLTNRTAFRNFAPAIRATATSLSPSEARKRVPTSTTNSAIRISTAAN